MEIRSEEKYHCNCTREEKESIVVAFKSLQALDSLLFADEKIVSNGIEYTKKDIEKIKYLLGGIALGRGFKIKIKD